MRGIIKKKCLLLLLCSLLAIQTGCRSSVPTTENGSDSEGVTPVITGSEKIPEDNKSGDKDNTGDNIAGNGSGNSEKTPEGTGTEDGNADNTKTPDGKDENRGKISSTEEAEKVIKKYANDIAKEKYDKVSKNFSLAVAEKIDEKVLSTIWSSTVILLGEYEGIENDAAEVVFENGYYKGSVKLRYENEEKGVLLTLVVSDNSLIEGLWINYYEPDGNSSEVTNSEAGDKREREVQIVSGGFALDGKLTIPEGTKNPPVVILVQGSGQSNMDEAIGLANNSPFRDIAIGLADRGVATLRYNKRYYQYPESADMFVTIYSEVLDDVYAAIDFVREYEGLENSDIYILGHSLGGMLAPKIAADNEEVCGIISLAGTPRRLEEVIYDQNMKAIDEMDTISEEEKETLRLEVKTMVEAVENISENEYMKPILGATGYYWNSLNEIDTRQILRELNIPMLILQGSEDFQIYEDVDFKEWENILAERDNVKFILYEGLNHLFMKAGEAGNITDYDISAHVDDKVIEDIAEWINEH